MVAAPKRVDPTIEFTNTQMVMRPTTLIDRRFWVPVGPDNARLLVSIVEPRPPGTRPRGTVIVLHGLSAVRTLPHVSPSRPLITNGRRRPGGNRSRIFPLTR